MATTNDVRQPVVTRYSPIVELRQYTLHRHRRDDLMTMFDAAFVEPQEAAGITVIGQFRNLDDPDKFVCLRGFPTMDARTRSPGEFYGGAAWRSRRTAANETIIDNDNVLLLRPVNPDAAFALGDEARSAVVGTEPGPGLVIANVYHLDPTDEKEREFIQFFAETVTPVLTAAGAPVVASFVHERTANGFPRLPVREGEHETFTMPSAALGERRRINVYLPAANGDTARLPVRYMPDGGIAEDFVQRVADADIARVDED